MDCAPTHFFFLKTLSHWKAGIIYPPFYIPQKEKKSYHKALIVQFECSLQQKRAHTQTGRKNVQCLFSVGYIPLHAFCPSCSELVLGKLFRELRQEYDKCEKQGFVASCQSKREKLKQASFYETISMQTCRFVASIKLRGNEPNFLMKF